MYHLLAFDLRGKDLEYRLRRSYTGRFHFLVDSGTTIGRPTDGIKEAMNYVPYMHVYLQAGVNELTTKVGPSLICNYNTTAEIVEDLKTKFQNAKEEILKKNRFIYVIISPLIGINLCMYNKEPWYHQEQELINDVVMELNSWIKHENATNSYETPMLD